MRRWRWPILALSIGLAAYLVWVLCAPWLAERDFLALLLAPKANLETWSIAAILLGRVVCILAVPSLVVTLVVDAFAFSGAKNHT